LAENELIDKPIVVTDASFKETISRHPMVVVDCWADWCQPCKIIAPTVEELAKELRGKVVFGKLDVDNNSAVPSEYGIMSIPTLLIFKGGKQVDSIVGAVPKPMIRAAIDRHMQK
jgi:thioredoxin 1